jgi:hemoglobin
MGWVLASVTAAGIAAGPATDPPSPGELDKRIRRAAHDAASAGTDLYNSGNHEGCARLYEGAIIALLPLVESKPDMADHLRSALSRGRTINNPVQRAFVLRKVLDELILGPKGKALWDRLGGQNVIESIVHEFVRTAAADPKVNLFRDGRYRSDPDAMARLERLLVEMLSTATGGPLKYTGRSMKASHAGMRISDEEFTTMVAILAKTLQKYQVSQADADELLTLITATKNDIVEVRK